MLTGDISAPTSASGSHSCKSALSAASRCSCLSISYNSITPQPSATIKEKDEPHERREAENSRKAGMKGKSVNQLRSATVVYSFV